MKDMSHASLVSLEIRTEEDAAANRSGTRALMLAVLEDAIQQFGSSAGHKRRQAERWIMSPERQHVFSFVVICEALDLEPSAVRRSLVRLLAKKPAGCRLLPRTRRNVRRTAAIELRSTERHTKRLGSRQTSATV
jgi:hypothetical protein